MNQGELRLTAMTNTHRHITQPVRRVRVDVCPHCGNKDPKFIEDNGVPRRDPDYTLLCVARVAPEKSSLVDFEPKSEPGPDGKVSCGWQWMPHS